jgi:hypothetical protein
VACGFFSVCCDQVEKDELVKINDEEVSVLEERLAAAGVPK